MIFKAPSCRGILRSCKAFIAEIANILVRQPTWLFFFLELSVMQVNRPVALLRLKFSIYRHVTNL